MPSGTFAALFHLYIRSDLARAFLRSRTHTLQYARARRAWIRWVLRGSSGSRLESVEEPTTTRSYWLTRASSFDWVVVNLTKI